MLMFGCAWKHFFASMIDGTKSAAWRWSKVKNLVQGKYDFMALFPTAAMNFTTTNL